MRPRTAAWAALALSGFIISFLHSSVAQESTSRPAAEMTGPPCRLAVVIVIDQFRADFLTRFGDLFVEDGLRLLMDRGAWFTNCHYDHGSTKTGPGHACIATGANPAVHGIVNNDWFEDAGGKYDKISCVQDAAASPLGFADEAVTGGRSPKRLLADTLADQLKAAGPNSRVLSCSLKDTAAVPSAGKSADQAYWCDENTGQFVTSSFYGPAMPAWASAFNDSRFVDQFMGKSWIRIAPAGDYDRRCRRDDAEYEWGSALGWSNSFPHVLSEPGFANPGASYYQRLQESPYGNELLLAFAKQGVEALKLGQRQVADMLIVSLSSNDLVGHRFGPLSHEVMDITLQTDRQLAEFFKFLDQKVGLKNCLIALSSDHGVCLIPEDALENGIESSRLNASQLDEKLEQALVTAFGTPDGSSQYVAGIEMPWLHFVPQAIGRVPPDKLRQTVEAVIGGEPARAGLFWAQDIERDQFMPAGGDKIRSRIKAAYYPGRSGQAYLHLRENWYRTGHATGHGSAYDYDTHVPLLLFGRNIKPGRYDAPASPTDIAPTLARLMHIKPPSKATGRVLHEALQGG